MITEYLMRPGQWELSLVDGTPLEVRRKFAWGANLVVTKTRIPDREMSLSSLYNAAVYAGLVFRRSDRLHRFGGPGIMGYIVTGKGSPGWGTGNTAPNPPTWPATFSTVITTWFSSADPSLTNGIISGTSYSPTVTTINSGAVQGAYFPPIKAPLDDLAALTGNEYRFKPNGTVDWGVSTSLFRSTPNVVVTPDGGGREGSVTVLKASRFDVAENIDNYRNAAQVDGVSNGVTFITMRGASATLSNEVDFNDHPLNNPNSFVTYGTNGPVELQTTSLSDATQVQGALASRYFTPERDYNIELDEYCISQYVTPGDWVYLYDPDSDVVDRNNQLQFQGRTLTPLKTRCVGYTWPVQAGMGVYVVQPDHTATPTFTDVTDYVQWETGSTRLEVNDTNAVSNLVDSYNRSVID